MSDAPGSATRAPWAKRLARAGFALALLAGLISIAIPLATRWGAIGSVRDAFGLMEWVVYGAAAAGVLALIGCVLAIIRNRPIDILLGTAGVVLAVLLVWIPYANRVALRDSPRLSDITTDPADPPAFVKARELREQSSARNPVTYGAEKRKLQAAHYPDIEPLRLPLASDAAFDRALATARDLGWAVVAAERTEGRIEAFDTSLMFGFVDDVVIRIRPADGESRIDVRSSSRIGRRDARVNANRVRRFLKAMATP